MLYNVETNDSALWPSADHELYSSLFHPCMVTEGVHNTVCRFVLPALVVDSCVYMYVYVNYWGGGQTVIKWSNEQCMFTGSSRQGRRFLTWLPTSLRVLPSSRYIYYEQITCAQITSQLSIAKGRLYTQLPYVSAVMCNIYILRVWPHLIKTNYVAVLCMSSSGTSLHNDTVRGDPLFSIPLPSECITDLELKSVQLCFEVHGQFGNYYNLISDKCHLIQAKTS